MAIPVKLRKTLLLLIFWRLIAVYVVQTFHVPDEYWQSLEVAHRLVFGYGYLSWEWRVKIRSYIYPFLISILYRLLAFFCLDYTVLLTLLPRVCQALLGAYADYRFYIWTRSKWALFMLCTNWFWYYCATRTLTNSLETSLTIIALSIFPWKNGRKQQQHCGFLWIVGFLTAVRPTAAILWSPLCLYDIWSSGDIFHTLKRYSFIGIFTVFYSILIDSLCYGAIVITPWEFFKANVLNSVGDFYGTHHLLWYLIAGLPAILGLQLVIFPVAALAAVRNYFSHRHQVVMIIVICWTIIIYSFLDHKEFRFILPLLPLFINVSTSFPFGYRITEFRRKVMLAVVILCNLLPGLYLCLIHQRGTLDIMKKLENELINSNSTKNDVLFLTPCHATPLYSHLHIDVPIRFLTCEPNLQKLPGYVDEAQEFFTEPNLWLDKNFEKKPLPELLIIFDNVATKIIPFLKNYQLLAKVFHAHFPQPNYGQYIMLYRRKFL